MSKEAMKLALEALKQIDEAMPFPVAKLAQAALREALAEQPASYKIRMDLPASISSEAIEADKLLKPQPAQHPKTKAIAECLAVLRPSVKGKFPHEQALEELVGYIAAPQPAQQEPVAFPARKAVEREIERTTSPTGMHLNDGKERVALPGGTLRHMLALIDRTSPPQRIWVGLTDDEIYSVLENLQVIHHRPPTTDSRVIFARAIEAKLKEKNSGD